MAVEIMQLWVASSAAQQFERFHRAVVSDEVVAAVVAPVTNYGAQEEL